MSFVLYNCRSDGGDLRPVPRMDAESCRIAQEQENERRADTRAEGNVVRAREKQGGGNEKRTERKEREYFKPEIRRHPVFCISKAA